MHWPFQIGRTYSRREDIHAVYGGQRQGGISTPAGVPGIFIFTGESGKEHGYADRFLPDGSFRFTGEGQLGPMKMRAGNKAIRDHASAGKDLLVFKASGKGRPVTFVNVFSCAGWELEPQQDRSGTLRDAIVFILVPIENINIDAEAHGPAIAEAGDLTELRYKALAAAGLPPADVKTATTTIYQRSEIVRQYVLTRARGRCEACGTDAPFITSSGSPYLEAHHIRRLTDGGPDDPRFMAGICPNCHRRAHYSADSAAFNAALLVKVEGLENLWVCARAKCLRAGVARDGSRQGQRRARGL